jgi:hypothetical protein
MNGKIKRGKMEDGKMGRWREAKDEQTRWEGKTSGAKQNKRAATRGEREKGKEMTESGKGNGPLSRETLYTGRERRKREKSLEDPEPAPSPDMLI